VGSTEAQVKQEVNLRSMVGGGLENTKVMVWGPLWWSQNTTKVVVVSDWPAAQGKGSSLQVTWEVWWGPHKNHKIIKTMRH
jgi:hypothetical protein